MTKYESLCELFLEFHPSRGSLPAVVDEDGVTTWRELADRVLRTSESLRGISRRAVGLRVPPTASGIVAMAACEALGCSVHLLDPLLPLTETIGLCQSLGLSDLLEPLGSRIHHTSTGIDVRDASSDVVILTSGTEGTPKAVRHTWKSILRTVRPDPQGYLDRWLLAFQPRLYAGLQVIGQGLANHGCLVMPPSQASVADTIEFMVSAGTTHASATPSYWRRLALFGAPERLASVPLRQITLGGEAVDQPLLDQLKRLFPAARITHIYATTELGRCFAVSDGRAGFPSAYLTAGAIPGVALEVREGELWARSDNAAGDLTWIATGDLVTIRDDRVEFSGRKGEQINVGGNKVDPWIVEQVIRGTPGVKDAIVFPWRSSIAGSLVACRVVMDGSGDASEVRQRIQEACGQRLQRHEIPRIIEFVETIALSAAGKRQRIPPVNEQS